MKDLLGREVQAGQYICYALTVGRSANLAVYEVREVQEDKIKAHKLTESYGSGKWTYSLYNGKTIPFKFCKWNSKNAQYEEMTEAEKEKVLSKVVTLSMPERIFILDGFTPKLLKNNTQDSEPVV